MGIKKILSLSILAFLTVSCASTSPDSGSVENVYVPTFKTLAHKGFTLVVPDETGWNVANESEYKVELAKRGEVSGEVYTIQALLVRLPAFDSDDDFKGYVEKSLDAIDQKTQSTVIEQGSSFIPYNDNQCVQFNRKTEKTVGASQEEGAAPMILEIVNFTCRHPLREDAGVYLAYAKRFQEGSAEEDLTPQALNLFYNLEFTDL
jgi:hypothetical protein